MRRSTRLDQKAKETPRMAALIRAQQARLRKEADEDEEEWTPDSGDKHEVESDDSDSDDGQSSRTSRLGARSAATRKRRPIAVIDEDEVAQLAQARQTPALKRKQQQAREVLERKHKTPRTSVSTSKTTKHSHDDKNEQDTRVDKAEDKVVNQLKKSTLEPHRRPMKHPGERQGGSSVSKPSASGPVVSVSAPSHTIDRFFENVLSWDFYASLEKECNKTSSTSDDANEISQVPSQFQSYDHYYSVWEPLALQEVQAQTINSVSTDHPPAIPITAQLLSHSYKSRTAKIRLDSPKDSSYKRPGRRSSDRLDSIFSNDLVLITPDRHYLESFYNGSLGRDKSAEEGLEPTRPAGALAITTSQKMSREGLTAIVMDTVWQQIDTTSDLYLFKLDNLVTSVREFRALCDCKNYPLLPLLLSGEHVSGSMRLDTLGVEYVKWLTRSFNESQLEAITAAATSDGFTLIKGPPGTGKTTTLKGLLNSLHLREYNRYYNAVLDVARRPDNETSKAWARIGNEKPHILVTAPSNAAVDNIVSKVIEEGFCDGAGRQYFPQIVRVGRGMSPTVRSVGLDDMVDQICSQPLEALEQRIHQLRFELQKVEYDSLMLRNRLRSVVHWIDADPDAAWEAQREQTKAEEPAQELEKQEPTQEETPKPMQEEEDEDEEFPIGGMHDSTVMTFGAAATNEAYSALLGDSNSEEDEPLPIVPSATNSTNDSMEDSEEDEPLPNQSKVSTPPPPPPTPPRPRQDDPPPPPSTPPPPPDEDLPPSSPKVNVVHSPDSIDYSRYEQYQVIAQQINFCLEKLSEIKLELQRYEFARQAVLPSGKSSQSARQSLEVSILDKAHIVFTTLSSAGVNALDASARYEVLVVDEAAQAVELSSIIPMKFGSRQCVLVGDPQQLPATVFSRTSAQSLYERSLFERLETCGHPVHMLRTQYRSHPSISAFPRHFFYEGKLDDGENVLKATYDKPYHHLGHGLGPLVFWNLRSSRESSAHSVSRLNVGEAELSVNLYLTLRNSCPPDTVAGKVGMITPYSQQLDELKKRFRSALGPHFQQEVEINTVDGFQGREKDIIILSTVRADPKKGVGFLNDTRRMNVALTRAKFACYVIGSEQTLRSSKPWAALLTHAYSHKCMVHVQNPTCNLLQLERTDQPPGSTERRPPAWSNHSHRPTQDHPRPPMYLGPPRGAPPPIDGPRWSPPPGSPFHPGMPPPPDRSSRRGGRKRGRGGRRGWN